MSRCVSTIYPASPTSPFTSFPGSSALGGGEIHQAKILLLTSHSGYAILSEKMGQFMTGFTDEDLEDLRFAKQILENPGITAKLTYFIGIPIEKGIELLPEKWSETIRDATRKALIVALNGALLTLDKRIQAPAQNVWHKVAVAVSGAGGGALGLPALIVELPVSTTIMLRSIADIARSEGEQLHLTASKLACMEVFALGGRSSKDDSAESGYFTVRAALAKAVSEAAEFIAERGLAREGAPAIIRLTTQIAERFGVTVSEKMVAQAVPAIGAIGGAMINLVFIDHFQDMARGHFTVRRLERKYGAEAVKTAYLKLANK